jgi:hypothetical protein
MRHHSHGCNAFAVTTGRFKAANGSCAQLKSTAQLRTAPEAPMSCVIPSFLSTIMPHATLSELPTLEHATLSELPTLEQVSCSWGADDDDDPYLIEAVDAWLQARAPSPTRTCPGTLPLTSCVAGGDCASVCRGQQRAGLRFRGVAIRLPWSALPCPTRSLFRRLQFELFLFTS